MSIVNIKYLKENQENSVDMRSLSTPNISPATKPESKNDNFVTNVIQQENEPKKVQSLPEFSYRNLTSLSDKRSCYLSTVEEDHSKKYWLDTDLIKPSFKTKSLPFSKETIQKIMDYSCYVSAFDASNIALNYKYDLIITGIIKQIKKDYKNTPKNIRDHHIYEILEGYIGPVSEVNSGAMYMLIFEKLRKCHFISSYKWKTKV